MRIAIAVSRFNEPVTSKLCEGAVARLKERGLPDEHVEVIWVPGAVELPLMAQQFAMTEEFHAVICLGSVIRGETDHYDYVCKAVTEGCMQVSLDFNLPVIFGVLTTENSDQAFARAGGDHSHKGIECADAALEMLEAVNKCKTKADSVKYA